MKARKRNEALVLARHKAGLTQRQVAHKLGMCETSYQKYERDAMTPSARTAVRIARVLNTTTEHLYGADEPSAQDAS